jgi:hypothetical protein
VVAKSSLDHSFRLFVNLSFSRARPVSLDKIFQDRVHAIAEQNQATSEKAIPQEREFSKPVLMLVMVNLLFASLPLVLRDFKIYIDALSHLLTWTFYMASHGGYLPPPPRKFSPVPRGFFPPTPASYPTMELFHDKPW